MKNGMMELEDSNSIGKEVPMSRNVGTIEFRGLIKGTIPVCDLFGEYDANGLAVVQKNGKIGVVDSEPKLVVPIEYEYVEVLLDGNILAYKEKHFYLYDKSGKLLTYSESFPEMKL